MADATLAPQLDLDRILANAQLPALPQSAIRLLELARSPTNGPEEFAVPIEADPGLAGQVLKFVNSAYFGFAREISSVKLAITMVGVRTIKNFVLWSAVFSLMPNPKCGPFDLKALWQDSLRRGLFARTFGKLIGLPEAEDLFAAALLQDMAVPLLSKELPTEYASLLEKRESGNLRLSRLEQDWFGWSHAEAGAKMARQWNLPEESVAMILNHTQMDDLRAQGGSKGQIAVALSAHLPAAADRSWCECKAFETHYRELSPPDAPSLLAFLEKVDQDFKEFAPVLKIAGTAKPMAESYREEVGQAF